MLNYKKIIILTCYFVHGIVFAQLVPPIKEVNRPSDISKRMIALESFISPFKHSLSTNEKKELLRGIKKYHINFCKKIEPPYVSDVTKYLMAYNKDHSRLGERGKILPALAYLVSKCKSSYGSVRNSAFLLDYMYWMKLSDLSGYEVSDTLVVRDAFFELMSLRLMQKYFYESTNNKKPYSDRQPFDEQGTLEPSKLLSYFGKAVYVFNQRGQSLVDKITEILDLKSDSLVIFGKDLLQLIDNKKDMEFMQKFYRYLLYLQQNTRELVKPHGGWKHILKLANGDKERVFRVIGILATMRHWVFEDLSQMMITKGNFDFEKAKRLREGMMAYYLMNQLDERSAIDDPNSKRDLLYHFFYPPGFRSGNWKIYHWYANAFIGCKLAGQGFTSKEARQGTTNLAQAYEYSTLNLVGPSKSVMKLESRVSGILEGADDIEINSQGGYYGASVCQFRRRNR